MRRLLILTLGLAAFSGGPLASQDAFDISVYPAATASRGEWDFDGQINYTNRGTTGFSGSLAPTQGQVRFTSQLTRGITDRWEISGFILGAQVPTLGLEYAGWRVRTRLRAPESWLLPVQLGLSVELENAQPAFHQSRRGLELAAVLERRIAGLQLIVNAAFERDLTGPGGGHEFEFEPKARASTHVSEALKLGVEYYSATGAGSWQQVFPTADIRVNSGFVWHWGVGFGTVNAADRLVFKTRFDLPL